MLEFIQIEVCTKEEKCEICGDISRPGSGEWNLLECEKGMRAGNEVRLFDNSMKLMRRSFCEIEIYGYKL